MYRQIFIMAGCQDPNTKSSPFWSNGSAIHYLPFILGFIFYHLPYYSLPTFFHSNLVHPLTSPSYQHCYTRIIKYQLWLHTDFILSKQQMFHLETRHSRLLYCYFLFYHFIYVSLLSRYIIPSFVLCTLALKIKLVSHCHLPLTSFCNSSPGNYSLVLKLGPQKEQVAQHISWGQSPIWIHYNLFGHSIQCFSMLSPELNTGIQSNFLLPRQHSMIHYSLFICQFWAPNGLCSSIMESKHIRAVKEPWCWSSRNNALGQMLVKNQQVDQLVAACMDFTTQGMLTETCLSEVFQCLGELTLFIFFHC